MNWKDAHDLEGRVSTAESVVRGGGLNWKEHAHLFANGEFSVNLTFYARLMEKNPYEIIGIRGPKFIIWDSMSCEYNDIGLEDCTLIARKIEDMTDEERMKYESLQVNINSNPQYQDDVILIDCPESFMYALSVGCLPEDFEHQFETGEVIDTKIKEAAP